MRFLEVLILTVTLCVIVEALPSDQSGKAEGDRTCGYAVLADFSLLSCCLI